MYPDKQAGTPMQATQVVYISVWKDKIMKTNTDLIDKRGNFKRLMQRIQMRQVK